MNRKNPGFTLIEVLIALAVVAVASVGFMQFMSYQSASQKSTRLTDELQNKVQEVRAALSAKDVCKANIINFTPPTFDRIAISSATSQPIILITQLILPSTPPVTLAQSGAAIPNSPNTVLQLSISDLKELVRDSAYLGNLKFAFDKGSGVMGSKIIKRDLPVVFQTTAAGTLQTIVNCTTIVGGDVTITNLNKLIETVCLASGGVSDPATGKCSGGSGPRKSPIDSGPIGRVGTLNYLPVGNSQPGSRPSSFDIPPGWFGPDNKWHAPAENPNLPDCGNLPMPAAAPGFPGGDVNAVGGGCYPKGGLCQVAIPINGYAIAQCGDAAAPTSPASPNGPEGGGTGGQQ